MEDLNLEEFLILERQQLKEERARLIARLMPVDEKGEIKEDFIAIQQIQKEQEEAKEHECAALEFIKNEKFRNIQCNYQKEHGLYSKALERKDKNEPQTEEYNDRLLFCVTRGSREGVVNDHLNVNVKNISKEQQSLPVSSSNVSKRSIEELSVHSNENPDNEIENAPNAALTFVGGGIVDRQTVLNNVISTQQLLTKNAKEWVNNRKEKVYLNSKLDNVTKESNVLDRVGNKDDMEQWVSDTFYSYFPSFNNEYQKRQNYLRDRQQEYQQNFLKHQMSHPLKSKINAQKSKTLQDDYNMNTARSSNSNATIATTSSNSITNHATTNKTDLEIIVTNPNYVPTKHLNNNAARPGTTRHKLLQDLRHTELSNMIADDGIIERNRQSAEMESARKKDYQRDLMQQIEDKRRNIEMLREKERKQEEALTRRLQEQLKTIQLEEQLEKEKMRADKLRFDTEQNRIMREHLLAKLENDTKLLYANKSNNNKPQTQTQMKSKIKNLEPEKDTVDAAKPTATSTSENNNRVYQYFSNSARHEYRRGKPMPSDVDFDLEIPDNIRNASNNIERECFHLSDKVCPMCDAPLKSYESCCLRCQKKLSLKMTVKSKSMNLHENDNECSSSSSSNNRSKNVEDSKEPMAESDEQSAHDKQSFSLVCLKCERLYTMCATCLAKSDVCRACHRKRNVCMNCRRTLCTFCLEEIACGKDTERTHINERRDANVKDPNQQSKTDEIIDSERSFQVLEVNYDAGGGIHKESDDFELSSPPPSSSPLPTTQYMKDAVNNSNSNVTYKNIHNNLNNATIRPPYSMNIERNSIFHPDYEMAGVTPKPTVSFEQLPKIIDKTINFDLTDAEINESSNMERVRRETDKRLTRYLQNYGDLALHSTKRSQSESRHRSTQTTPETAARRDVVINEGHNLSMPLLREMPKMTRKESSQLLAKSNSGNAKKIDNLNRRWEIPAVQKFTISSTSPRVLTQVGAIRKQLQTDRLLMDDADDY